MVRRIWFERKFELGLELEALPEILERLRGTPARLEERVACFPPADLVRRVHDTWSIQENAGHLLDLEPLWAGRLEDLVAGADELRVADLSNRATDQAGHNRRPIEDLLQGFRTARMQIVDRLESLSTPEIGRTALHPRLRQPMSAADLFYFVAEHDDHHLARITEIARQIA